MQKSAIISDFVELHNPFVLIFDNLLENKFSRKSIIQIYKRSNVHGIIFKDNPSQLTQWLRLNGQSAIF